MDTPRISVCFLTGWGFFFRQRMMAVVIVVERKDQENKKRIGGKKLGLFYSTVNQKSVSEHFCHAIR